MDRSTQTIAAVCQSRWSVSQCQFVLQSLETLQMLTPLDSKTVATKCVRFEEFNFPFDRIEHKLTEISRR